MATLKSAVLLRNGVRKTLSKNFEEDGAGLRDVIRWGYYKVQETSLQ